MSLKAMTWVWEHCTERSTGLLMLLAIADHCNDEGVCYPSVGRLAAKCRITVRRAQQIIEGLKQSGDLGVLIGKGVESNGGHTNRYFLNCYRHSIGLPPVFPSSKSSPSDTESPPAKNFREGDEANIIPSGTPPPEEICREGDEAHCTGPPETDCTTLPETDFRLNRHYNRHRNRHLSSECEEISTHAYAHAGAREDSPALSMAKREHESSDPPPRINREQDHAEHSNPAEQTEPAPAKDSYRAFLQYVGATQRG